MSKEFKPKEGDFVEVAHSKKVCWNKRIFLYSTKAGHHIAVSTGCEIDYQEGGSEYLTTTWEFIRPVQPSISISIDIKINGQPAKLSDISEETLLSLRKNN